jgi:hypothetical protein
VAVGQFTHQHHDDVPQLTKVFAKAGLDIVTSAMCKHQAAVGLDIQFSALVLNFNNIFSIGHLYRAGQSMNSLPSQILERYGQLEKYTSKMGIGRREFLRLTGLALAGLAVDPLKTVAVNDNAYVNKS